MAYDRTMDRSNVPPDLASRLNQRRRALGLGIKDLVERTDLSRSNLQSLMSGKRSPTPAVAEKLIAALELDDDFAAELRSLEGSRYQSGFAQGEVKLSDNTA